MDIFNEDLRDLPKELIREIKIITSLDEKVLNLFKQAGGVLSLSRLLIGYYRTHKEVKKRQYMMVVCYRMIKKGLLFSTDKKGEYSITKKGLNTIE